SDFVGFRRRLQALAIEAGKDEAVDRIARPALVLDGRRIGALGRHIGPVRFPFCALVDPLAYEFDLLFVQSALGENRRHAQRLIGIADALVEPAGGRVRRRDDGEEAVFSIEAQLGLALFFVRTVAGEAGVGKDRANVAVEVDWLWGGSRRYCEE